MRLCGEGEGGRPWAAGTRGSRGRAASDMNRRTPRPNDLIKLQTSVGAVQGKDRLPRSGGRDRSLWLRIVTGGDDATIVAVAVSLADLGDQVRRPVVQGRTHDACRSTGQFLPRCAEVEVDARQQQRAQKGHRSRQPDEPPLVHES